RSRIGRNDGETMAPTVIGAARPVQKQPIATKSTGYSLVRSSTSASIAPPTAKVNKEPSIDTSNHAANVGRERGSESPRPVSPARAARTGRNAPCTEVCNPISAMATPKAAPKIPYWTSRDQLAPETAPTSTKSDAVQTGWKPNARTPAARVQLYVSCSAVTR